MSDDGRYVFADDADTDKPCIDCKSLLVYTGNSPDGRCSGCRAEAAQPCRDCGVLTTQADRQCLRCWALLEL